MGIRGRRGQEEELSSHLGGGIGAVFSTWSLYVLLAVGAVAMLLASHALAAGPLAASQPGFTILDPLSAALLGVFLFAEHIRTSPWDLAGEALALVLVIAGAWGLSRSCFILGESGDPSCLPARSQAQARGKRLPSPARRNRDPGLVSSDSLSCPEPAMPLRRPEEQPKRGTTLPTPPSSEVSVG